MPRSNTCEQPCHETPCSLRYTEQTSPLATVYPAYSVRNLVCHSVSSLFLVAGWKKVASFVEARRVLFRTLYFCIACKALFEGLFDHLRFLVELVDFFGNVFGVVAKYLGCAVNVVLSGGRSDSFCL